VEKSKLENFPESFPGNIFSGKTLSGKHFYLFYKNKKINLFSGKI